jgi:hypothetical protein
VTDIIDAARQDIEKRLRDLRDEVRRLEAAASALAGAGARRGPGRPRGSTTRTRRRTRGRRGRPRGGGTRSAQALKFVQQNPGITIPELATKMRIKPNYLYRVLPELQSDGKVKKRNKGWHPA